MQASAIMGEERGKSETQSPSATECDIFDINKLGERQREERGEREYLVKGVQCSERKKRGRREEAKKSREKEKERVPFGIGSGSQRSRLDKSVK
jgi:hypothetical protein